VILANQNDLTSARSCKSSSRDRKRRRNLGQGL